ncbi:hypothetical protein [Paraburkholderia phenoliruptrix]|uniref:hypothetical protein n=1 Tax=Paraburkholderia phenoliruptrix TaxID=252970 RepID=UPI0039B6CEAB
MLSLFFYRNSRGALIGELQNDDSRLLATSHPATIAAAVFAMNEHSVRVDTDDGSFEMQFPFNDDEFDSVGAVIKEEDVGYWMSLFCTFSRFDFLNPLPYDNHAETHFRTAVHHLPPELVKIRLMAPEPKDFKKQLKKRNRYIYYPWE